MTPDRKRLIDLIAREYGIDRDLLAPASQLDALGLDSLDLASLAVDIEDEFGVTLPDLAQTEWQTVADIIATLARCGKDMGT